MIKKFAFAILGTFCILNNYGQSFASDGWIRSEGIQKSFIENKGQFSIPNSQQQVFYGYGTPQQSIFLTNEGITYTFLKQWRQEEKEKQKEKFDNAKEYRKHEENERKLKFKTDVISVRWLNANKDCKPYGAEEIGRAHV